MTNIEKIIFNSLNEWIVNVEDKEGYEMRAVQDYDFDDITKEISKKINTLYEKRK